MKASLLNVRARVFQTGDFAMMTRFLAGVCLAALMPAAAMACEADAMMTTDDGFIFKIVAGSDKIQVYADPTGTEEAFQMELLQPYFVICQSGDYYRVTDLQAGTVDEALAGNTGYVLAEQAHPWPTREALSFSEIAFLE
jgi:hypothetical protein